jgi:hypothetical protein
MKASSVQARKLRDVIWQAAGYTPTSAQLAYHRDTTRLKLVAGGIRAGKSKSTSMDVAGDIWLQNGLIWIVGPDYEQCKPEWDYLFEPLRRLGLINKYSAPERGGRSFETTWGARVQTKSSDDTRALASYAPHTILMVEAGQQSYETFQKILERGLEHNAKIICSGTFEGALSWYADLFERWQGENPEDGKSFSLPTWSNTFIFPGGRNDPKIAALEAAMPEELFQERCGAVPYKPSGLVFKEFDRAKHVKRVDFDPKLPIELAIDPATHTYAILAIQWDAKVKPTPVYVVDEVYTHDMIAQDVIPLVKEKPWFKFVKSGVIDIAGTQRQANKSQVQIWAEETGIALRSNYVFIEDSIDVVKLRLRGDAPLLAFDFRLRSDKSYAGKANGLVAEFGLYKWRDWAEGRNAKRKPIDSNNDALKALGYWLYDRFGPVTERKKLGKTQIAAYYING